jgi:phosphoribosylaminoimidazolecarboxamide formyltransferase/IMP cyclohydrolase
MKKIRSALISVFYKDGLESIVHQLNQQGVIMYSTGGTRDFIEQLGVTCVPVESLTGFPSILGGRVKTLHPLVFGAILGKRSDETHRKEMQEYGIPEFDLVMVDLYPFEETVQQHASQGLKDESPIIEKIDIGGPSMIRAAAKNHQDVVVVSSKEDYALLLELLQQQEGQLSLEQRRYFAIRAFDVCTRYDQAISNYFNQTQYPSPFGVSRQTLRYGENPHQKASFIGDMQELFEQLHGKELSYNNVVDVDAAIQLIREFDQPTFAIIKHTNVCGIASAENIYEAWTNALAGDPESAFGGVLISNKPIDLKTAEAMQSLFFEVLMAPVFDLDALELLKQKKNRMLLRLKETALTQVQIKSMLNGLLVQAVDEGNEETWNDVGGRVSSTSEATSLRFANLVAKHLKSNAIAIVKGTQLIGKGCGQTSRVDALRQAIEKSRQFGFELEEAVLASDAFFPFDDCVKMAHAAGIKAFIQPGGSIRDNDSINYCVEQNLAMVITGKRHFKH